MLSSTSSSSLLPTFDEHTATIASQRYYLQETASLLEGFFTDKVYVVATLSIFVLHCGVYFPTFFLQLAAVKNGLSTNLAFYTQHSDYSIEWGWYTGLNNAYHNCRPG
ncbi:hypothetical protein BT96DRAFT_981615, partial [Gymnopus androsaceus JB14]